MATILPRAAIAACARASKRRRVSVPVPPPSFPSLRALTVRAASTSVSTHQEQLQPPQQKQQHLLRIVDLTTMRAAAASLRAFGGAGTGAAERALDAAAAAAQTDPDRRLTARQTANDPSDPPLLIPHAAASALQEALAAQLLLPLPPPGVTPPTPATAAAKAAAAAANAAAAATRTHTLVLLQHAPVFTVGKRGRGHGFATDAHMRAALSAGASLDADSPRGGQATFHGPGQAVAYPVVCLRSLGLGARRYVEALEDACVRAAGRWGVHAEGRQPAGRTGVWAGGRKVAAVGVRVSRGVATHGLAFNVADDRGGGGGGGGGAPGGGGGVRRSPLAWFRLIDPCGLGAEGLLVGGGGGGGDEDDDDDDGVTTSLWRELRRGGARGPPPEQGGGGGGDQDSDHGDQDGGRPSGSLGGWPTVRGAAGDVAHALAAALGARAVYPGDDDGGGGDAPRPAGGAPLPPLPPEAARAALEGLACTAAGMAARPPRL